MEHQFIFTTPFQYELKGIGDKQELIVKGDISTTDPDMVNDIVSLKCLKSMMSQIGQRNIKIDLEHETLLGNTNEEKEISKTIIPKGRIMEPVIREINTNGKLSHALGIKAVFNRFNSRFEEIKNNVTNGFLDAFSIAFIPTQTKKVIREGKEFRMLDDLNLINVAVTGNPINTGSQMRDIVAKSVDAVEQYKASKQDNPDFSDRLEVKADHTNRNRARNEAISEDEEEDEEKSGHKKKKKKKSDHEVKAYEADGAHEHTENILGLHTHPEIEKIVGEIADRLNDKIDFLAERIFESLEAESPRQKVNIKSKLIQAKPFAEFSNFQDCVNKNRDKTDPQAFCATIQRQVEGKGYSTNNQEKFFRNGKEIDPKTGEPISRLTPPKESSLNKLKENDKMNEEGNDKVESPESPEEGSEEKPADNAEKKDEPKEGEESVILVLRSLDLFPFRS